MRFKGVKFSCRGVLCNLRNKKKKKLEWTAWERHCFFTRSKLDKYCPRTWVWNTTHSKNDFCPTLADLKSQAKLADHWRRRTINQSDSSRKTCRPIGSHCVARRRKLKIWESNGECQTATLTLACQSTVWEILEFTKIYWFMGVIL